MNTYLYESLKGRIRSKSAKLLHVMGVTMILSFMSGCTPSDTNYIQTEIGGIPVCDLDIVDTRNLLGVDRIDSNLSSGEIISLYEKTQTEWKTSDINISRCSPKKSPDAQKVLRIHVPKEKWSYGFQFTYDLYFDEDDHLVAVESRHRFINI